MQGVERGPLLLNGPARVLPCLPGVVPMEAKLGQNAGDRRRLLVRKLNPDPLPDHFGQVVPAHTADGNSEGVDPPGATASPPAFHRVRTG